MLLMQQVWKVSTTAGSKRVKKNLSIHETSTSNNNSMKESDGSYKSGTSMVFTSATGVSSADSSLTHVSFIKVPSINV